MTYSKVMGRLIGRRRRRREIDACLVQHMAADARNSDGGGGLLSQSIQSTIRQDISDLFGQCLAQYMQ